MTSEKQAQNLRDRFYAWEELGRGRILHPFPVALEPPFRPFFHPKPEVRQLDDRRRHTLLSWLLERFRREAPSSSSEEREPKPSRVRDLSELSLYLPADFRGSKTAAEGFLRSLLVLRSPLSWEVTSESGTIRYGLALDERDRSAVAAALKAFLPGVVLAPRESLTATWNGEEDLLIAEFGLAREFMFPLESLSEPDPLLPLLALFSEARDGETLSLQVLFSPGRRPWNESILRSARSPSGLPLFADCPDIIKEAERKVAEPLFAVAVRLAIKAQGHGRRFELLRIAAGALANLGRENSLVPLTDNPDVFEDFLLRRSRRSGMLLNLSELASLVHLPGREIHLSGIERGSPKEKAPPPEALSEGVLLGEVRLWGRETRVYLPEAARLRHTHVIGATGTGKTTLLLNLILEDIRAGRGVGVIDPHGDLAPEILARIPEERLSDVRFLDPGDPEVSRGWNMLEARSEAEREVLSADLVSLWKRYATSWGDLMSVTLANSVAALLSLPGSVTLSDLRRFLVERSFRESLLPRLSDPELRFFWEKEFPHIGERSLGPILGRLNTFLRSRPVREALSDPAGIDFRGLLDRGEILIARLPQGTLGEENTAILGSLLVSKLHQTALSRADMAPEKRRPFHLFLDEFHLFATPSLVYLLSGARKFGLSLCLAHQSLSSLHGRFPEIESSLTANIYSHLIFRVGEDDARRLERSLSTFEAGDLLNLKTGQAVCRMGARENDFLFSVREPARLAQEERVSRTERARDSLKRRVPLATIEPPETESVELLPPVVVRREQTAAPPLRREVVPRPERRHEPLGRGGPEHQYLQELVKRLAEVKGFRVTIEKPILEGRGKVDVALEREGYTLACEISVTTSTDHEVGNVQKCLEAGFSEVALVSIKKPKLGRVRASLAERVNEEDLRRVLFLTPEELMAHLETLARPEVVETVGGRRVRVRHQAGDPAEAESRRQAVAKVIARSLGRLNKES